VAKANLREERIDRSSLDTAAPAPIAQGCGVYVIFTIWHDERNRGETTQDLNLRFGAREALQQFLQDQASGKDQFATLDGPDKSLHFVRRGRGLSPKGERPDARIDEEAHSRLRSAL
jgi:hypothetical protein